MKKIKYKDPRLIKEIYIEQYLVKQAKFFGYTQWKLGGSGCAGLPDRLIAAKGRFWLVELKRPVGGVLSGLQKLFRRKAEENKAKVYYAHTKETVDKFFKMLNIL